jgi:hypothetical protein
VIDRAVGLEQAVDAYRAVAAGAPGRVVLVPSAPWTLRILDGASRLSKILRGWDVFSGAICLKL